VPRGASSAEEAEIVGAVQKLEGLVGGFAGDTARLLALEAIAFGEQPAAGTNSNETGGYAQLRIKNFLVTNTVRQDPQVSAAVTAVLARKRGHGGDVLGDIGPNQQDLSVENEAVRQEEKTMEQLGWIASATSPGTSFLVDGVGKDEDELANREEGDDLTNNSAQASTSTEQTAQKSKHTTPPSPQIPHPTTTSNSHPRRSSNQLLSSPPTTEPIEPAPLPPLDPGELADTEGETPAPTPAATHSHTHHHKHSHSHGHKTNMGASVELLGESEIREAKKEMEKVEGYEGDVDV